MQLQGKAHIAAGREKHHQVVCLKNKAHIQPQLGELLLAGPMELLAEDAQAAIHAGAQAAKHGEQRCFARAGRAGANHDLAGIDVEADVFQGMLSGVARAKPVVDLLEGDHRLPRRAGRLRPGLGGLARRV